MGAVIDDGGAGGGDFIFGSRDAEKVDFSFEEFEGFWEDVGGGGGTEGGLIGIHEGLGGEEVGIDEAGEEEALVESGGEAGVMLFEEGGEWWELLIGDFGWGGDVWDIGAEGFVEAFFEAGVGFMAGVEESGVMAGDGVCDEVTERGGGDGVFGSGGGVVDFLDDFVVVEIGGFIEIGLEFLRKFPEVVPEAG